MRRVKLNVGPLVAAYDRGSADALAALVDAFRTIGFDKFDIFSPDGAGPIQCMRCGDVSPDITAPGRSLTLAEAIVWAVEHQEHCRRRGEPT